jgi:peptide/nickel transport system substrate-binding protein
MKKGPDGFRTFPDGSPFTILWEYSSQFAVPEFVKLMSDYLKALGLNVNAKEVTSEATRDNAKAAISDINMEWDVPFEPTLVANVDLYVPYYSDISPLFGVKWRQWYNSGGKEARSRQIGSRRCSVLPKSGEPFLRARRATPRSARSLSNLTLRI